MFSPKLFLKIAVGITTTTSFFKQAGALHAEYCAPINTGQTPGNSSIFQSNGLCFQFCLEDYAFAILQWSTCWCSNDAPSVTTSSAACHATCPGYPDDLCGNIDEGLFGYFSLPNNSPTATVGGSAASSTPPSQGSSSAAAVTSSLSTSSLSSFSSSWTPTPIISLETVTGEVRTVTVTPTIPPGFESSNGTTQKSGGSRGLSTGGAVGLTIGLVVLVALVAGLVYFCIRKRQKENKTQMEQLTEGSRRGSSAGFGGTMASRIPSRTMSENSRYLLGTDGRQVVETWEPESREAPGSRKSRLMPVDPRLDPFAPVYQRGENKSRESVNTIRDDHDYSRRVHQQAPILRATNPDE